MNLEPHREGFSPLLNELSISTPNPGHPDSLAIMDTEEIVFDTLHWV
ncbi:MAG: hypothetical protein V7731_19790 [Amphritea sp.]